MHVEVAETGPCSRTVTIKVPPTTIQEHLDEAYAQASQHAQIKGFRQGKIPRKVLEKRFGKAILAEAKEKIVSQSFETAVREHELTFVGRPRVEGIGEEPLDAASELQFTVLMDVRPTFELGEVKGIEVKGPDLEVKDEDVDRALQDIADRKKSLTPSDGPVGEDDFAKGNVVFRNEAGEEVLRRDGAQVTSKMPLPGVDAEAFAKALVGTAIGDTATVEIEFPDNFDKEEVRGQKGTFAFEVTEVTSVSLPPIDDELAKEFEFDNLEALRTDLRERIAGERERLEHLRMEEDVLKTLMEAHPYELPDSLVEEQKQHSLHGFAQRLQQAGMGEDDIRAKLEESQEEAAEDARNKVRAFFMLDAIARQQEITVDDQDLHVELHNIAEANNAPLEQVQAYFQQEGRIADLRVGIMERKVREFLRENATITDN